MDQPINSAKKIVLVEDDEFICKAYTQGLTRAGFMVIAVMDGNEAINKVKSERPDIILLDLILPNKDGFSILEELKVDIVLKNIPVLILSNLGQGSDVQKAMQLGAADYLVKSNVSLKEVIEKVRQKL